MRIRFAVALLSIVALFLIVPHSVRGQDPKVVFLDQGSNWTPATRSDYYDRDQGSRMIRWEWLRALKQANGKAFLDDGLARYGYLQNPASARGLPVGFTLSGPTGSQTVGMTCSACHTRQIVVGESAYRVDGGPAVVDFQRLLVDLDVAVGKVLASDASFRTFAVDALAIPNPQPDDIAGLKREVDAWYKQYSKLMSLALPTPPWGTGRVDAVGMIFNRLTGLDLGAPPNLMIEDNIKKADAPVRYPFLWNAPKQDKTQWMGFAENGSDLLALARNLGQVYGVFGVFQPQKHLLGINYLHNNSANFDGLSKIEELVKKIGPPKWPWPIDLALAARGKTIYEREDQNGCIGCHGEKPGTMRLFNPTWKTRIENVGTDTRQFDILSRKAKSGVLNGAYSWAAYRRLTETDTAFDILAASVAGSILDNYLRVAGTTVASDQFPEMTAAPRTQTQGRLPPSLRELEGAFRPPTTPGGPAPTGPQAAASASDPVQKGAYEARVLEGIWAAAPYLHNGSVPTLADLLTPAPQRPKVFSVGPNYDIVSVGLAKSQPATSFSFQTTDCANLNSGNSNCGHVYGTTLPAADKAALIEYLKKL